MINFNKVVSIIVLFSFVLCSCGSNKDPLTTTCCYDENMVQWGLKKSRCIDPKKGVCYNTNIVPRDNSKGISSCCLHDDIDRGLGECVDPAKHSCYVDPTRYTVTTVMKFLERYRDYGYDETIKEIYQKLSVGMMLNADAVRKADERVSKIPKPVEIDGEAGFEREVLSSDKPVVLVVFSLPGCPHCVNFSPTVNELASTYDGKKAKICKVNTSKTEELLKSPLLKKLQIEIKGFPCSILFKKGKDGKMVLAEKIEGNKKKEILEESINKALPEEK
ncbi:MAG: thioredoxin [Endomicrobium sp.]|uniref:thioredoxin family protein n=1 Tax=Candidatus Endomicrobiellum pyrsonymphae TaxID=1408203 RepID=UPI0035769FCB|nr:thioredoxin [Endomicrobium sp.]